jgi:glucose-fructose oxidoreductase
MAVTEAECQQMIEACEQNAVKLMIAYRLHFEAGNLQAVDALKSGKIGEPRLFNSIFTQQVEASNIRMSR